MAEAARERYDLVIIGGGPAGLAAGIYGGRARLKTLILEKDNVGGRAYTTREIVNYPSVAETTGPALMEQMRAHAEKFGVEIRKEAAKSIDVSGEMKLVKTRRHVYEAQAVVIATGTTARKLGIPGEEEFTGMGVAYCATCDAEFFQDQEVVVVGSGDQGIEEGLYICKFASKVTVVVIHDEGILDCNKVAQERAFAEPKMHFLWNSSLVDIYGKDNVEGVHVKNSKTGEVTDFPCQGVFFFCGMIPETKFLESQVPTDSRGWLHTGDDMDLGLGGVFAAGDVRQKYLRQVATAVSDGAAAATAAERYISEMNDFRTNVLESGTPTLLGFWSPEIPGSLELLNQLREENERSVTPCRFMELDITRKKSLALKYQVSLTGEQPAVTVLAGGV